MIIADEIAGMEVRSGPDQELLECALGVLGLQLEDLEDVILEMSAGLRPGADLTARMAELERQARVDDLTGVLTAGTGSRRSAARSTAASAAASCSATWTTSRPSTTSSATPPATRRSPRSPAGSRATAPPAGSAATSSPSGSRATPPAAPSPPRRILDEVAGVTADVPEPRPPLGVSIGTVTVANADQSLTDLGSRAADAALYEAKRVRPRPRGVSTGS